MERQLIQIKTHQDSEVESDAMREQRAACRKARCALIGRRGCIMESILPDDAKVYLAQPCSDAVTHLPDRQIQ